MEQKNYFLVGQKCVVFNGKGEILILRRSVKSGGGGWSLIGGGLEKGEDPIASLKREALEEAQIEIFDVRPIGVKTFEENGESVVIIGYQAKTDSSNVTLNWEHDEYKWITKEEAQSAELSDTVIDLINHTSKLY